MYDPLGARASRYLIRAKFVEVTQRRFKGVLLRDSCCLITVVNSPEGRGCFIRRLEGVNCILSGFRRALLPAETFRSAIGGRFVWASLLVTEDQSWRLRTTTCSHQGTTRPACEGKEREVPSFAFEERIVRGQHRDGESLGRLVVALWWVAETYDP